MSREMKDSGVEHIGLVPCGWNVCRLKNFASICNGQDCKDVYDEEGMYPVIGSGGIFSSSKKYLYDKESVLLGRKGTIDKPLFVDYPFWTVDTMFYTKINDDTCSKYLYYLCLTIPFDYYQFGTALPSMTQQNLNNIFFPKPSLEIQQKIADFLDSKCATIDRLISLQEEMIAELQAYKQSVITEAVTKGLDPDVPMKDSGVERIGDTPRHWFAVKLKFLCLMNSGVNLTSEAIMEAGLYPVYGGNDVRGYYNEYNCDGDCLLVGRQGALCGNVIHVSGQFWATEHAIITRVTRLMRTRYLFYLLTAMSLNQYSISSAQPGLSVGFIKNLSVMVPELEEQNEISEHLDKRIYLIDALLQSKQSKIDTLKEYKKSLIYECVTGKREVV